MSTIIVTDTRISCCSYQPVRLSMTRPDVTSGFSLEELLDENPLFSSENGRISIVSRESRVNQMKKPGHKIEVRDPQVIKAVQDSLAEKKSPDEIIDEILKAGFYQHSKIFQGQRKLISRENHKNSQISKNLQHP